MLLQKTILIKPTKESSPRMVIRTANGRPFAMQNIELVTTYTMDEWYKWIKQINAKSAIGLRADSEHHGRFLGGCRDLPLSP